MKNKNIIKLFAFLWSALLIVSCSNEDLDRKDGPTVPEGLPVTMKLNVGTPDVPIVETRAVDNGDTFGDINNVGVLSYNSKGEDVCGTYVSDKTASIQFNTKTGKRKTYVLVNLPEELKSREALEGTFKTENDIFNYQIKNTVNPTEPTGKEMMMGYVVLAENSGQSGTKYDSNYKENDPANRTVAKADEITVTGEAQSFVAHVVPPYSHVNFIIDNQCIMKQNPAGGGINVVITSITVHNMPSKYSLFPKAWGVENVLQSYILGEDLSGTTLKGSDFYIFENAQGVNSDVTSSEQMYKRPIGWSKPTPLEKVENANFLEWEPLWKETACSYIEVKGYYAKWKSGSSATEGERTVGDIKYRFFLGENNYSSLDLKRNTKYKVTLSLSTDAGYNEIVANWRVGAELKTIGFSHRVVLMDGEAQKDYPFVVINNTNQKVSIHVTGFEYSPWKVGNTHQNAESGNQDFGVGNKGGTDFLVYSEQLAVVASSTNGSAPFTDYSTNTEYKNNSYGGKYTVDVNDFSKKENIFENIRSGSVYREIRVDAMLNGTAQDVLFIRQYPLLYLPNITNGSVKAGPYVERIEEEGMVSSSQEASDRCAGLASSSSSTDGWALPTVEEFKVMINEKTKDIRFPLNNGLYWTQGGLYDLNGKFVSNSGSGFVRCVMKMRYGGSLN